MVDLQCVLIPGIQQSESVTHIHISTLFFRFFFYIDHYRVLSRVPDAKKRKKQQLRAHREKAMAPHSSTVAQKIPWMEEPGRLQSTGSLRVRHNWVTSFTFHFHALEKEMATHSSVLAWKSPETEKPGRLQSMGSHRVGHDWSNLAAARAHRSYPVLIATAHHCGSVLPPAYIVPLPGMAFLRSFLQLKLWSKVTSSERTPLTTHSKAPVTCHQTLLLVVNPLPALFSF